MKNVNCCYANKFHISRFEWSWTNKWNSSTLLFWNSVFMFIHFDCLIRCSISSVGMQSPWARVYFLQHQWSWNSCSWQWSGCCRWSYQQGCIHSMRKKISFQVPIIWRCFSWVTKNRSIYNVIFNKWKMSMICVKRN